MRRIVSVILTAALIISTLCGCSLSGIADNVKGVFDGNTAAKSKAKDKDDNGNAGNKVAKVDLNVPGRKDILGIAEKYYKLAKSKATAEELGYINQLVVWTPDFTGKTADKASAIGFSYLSAFLSTYTDLGNVFLALNAAVFSFDVENPVSAGNLASAMVSYYEAMEGKPLAELNNKIKKNLISDAGKVYAYALSLTAEGKTVGLEAMPLLLNYGYFCIDTDQLKIARQMFEAAIALDPEYFPANEGMAAYWLAAGNKRKAEEILEKAKKPTIYAVIVKNSDNTSEKTAPSVTADEDLPVMEEKLEKLSQVPVVLATDFYEDLDPEAAADARRFVNNLAAEWKYTVPNYDYLSQYSTLSAFDTGQGRAAFEAFSSQMEEFAKKFTSSIIDSNLDIMESLGLELDLGGIDMEDLLKNPEKYEDMDIDVNVKGLEGFLDKMTDLAGMAEMAGKAAESFKQGNTSALFGTASKTVPEMAIMEIVPGKYANPTDVLTQKYNMTVLLRKLSGYKEYFFKKNQEVTDKMNASMNNALRKAVKMDGELNKLEDEHDKEHYFIVQGAKVFPVQDFCEACIKERHKIHEIYHPQLDNLAETSFGDATNYINTQFKQKLKPRIEAMYADCMKNCMLISDPEIRRKVEEKINHEVYQAVYNAFLNVMKAYSIGPGGYPQTCNCNEELIAELREKERKEFEEAEYYKTIMENKARKEFEAGIIKESSQLYQRLDKYTGNVKLMFF